MFLIIIIHLWFIFEILRSLHRFESIVFYIFKWLLFKTKFSYKKGMRFPRE